MTLKELTYEVRQRLQTELGVQFKQAHIYELLAAAFGFKSWAAFSSAAVLLDNCDGFQGGCREDVLHVNIVRQRCQNIGYSAEVADKVPSLLFRTLENRCAEAIKISQLLPWADEIFPSGQLMEMLNAAANKGNVAAHAVLAAAYAEAIRSSEAGSEGAYWWQQSQSGRALTSAEKEWADNYVSHMERKRQVPAWKRQLTWHLKEALRLRGQPGSDDDMDWMDMWSLADEFELPQEARQCLEKSAERGNISAICAWIDEYGTGDVYRSWVLFFLAKMLGDDLFSPRANAIYEDGSPYDDDVGGPCYVDEYSGIVLETMDKERREAAKKEAEALFSAIEQKRKSETVMLTSEDMTDALG